MKVNNDMKHKPACSAMRPNTAPASPAEAVIIYFDKEISSMVVTKSQKYGNCNYKY